MVCFSMVILITLAEFLAGLATGYALKRMSTEPFIDDTSVFALVISLAVAFSFPIVLAARDGQMHAEQYFGRPTLQRHFESGTISTIEERNQK